MPQATLSKNSIPTCRLSGRGGTAGFYFSWVQGQFLNPPVGDLPHIYFVVFAAVHLVNGAELLQLFTAGAELAENGAIEFHLIDGRLIEVLGVGIGGIQILVRPGSDAQGPG